MELGLAQIQAPVSANVPILGVPPWNMGTRLLPTKAAIHLARAQAKLALARMVHFLAAIPARPVPQAAHYHGVVASPMASPARPI